MVAHSIASFVVMVLAFALLHERDEVAEPPGLFNALN